MVRVDSMKGIHDWLKWYGSSQWGVGFVHRAAGSVLTVHEGRNCRLVNGRWAEVELVIGWSTKCVDYWRHCSAMVSDISN